MNRNVIVLIALVLAQLAVAYLLQVMPEVVTWSWQIRLAVAFAIVLGVGGIAFRLFVGSFWLRMVSVAVAAAIPSIIAEAISWSDPAYPGFGYLVSIAMALVASLGALISYSVSTSRSA